MRRVLPAAALLACDRYTLYWLSIFEAFADSANTLRRAFFQKLVTCGHGGPNASENVGSDPTATSIAVTTVHRQRDPNRRGPTLCEDKFVVCVSYKLDVELDTVYPSATGHKSWMTWNTSQKTLLLHRIDIGPLLKRKGGCG